MNKILIAGVGGQGIVYLTNIIAEAAMVAGIPVKVSEIHGLSQRAGIVTAGIGLGGHSTGFIGESNVDLLIGLEALETQRCLPFLHAGSAVVFGDHRIPPYSVKSEAAQYPDTGAFARFLEAHCRQVVFVTAFPADIAPMLYNVYLLGIATRLNGFPIPVQAFGQAIRNTVSEYQLEKTLAVFNRGIEDSYNIQNNSSRHE